MKYQIFPTHWQTLLKMVLVSIPLLALLLSFHQHLSDKFRPIYKLLHLLATIAGWIGTITSIQFDFLQLATAFSKAHNWREMLWPVFDTTFKIGMDDFGSLLLLLLSILI
jgi:hypothetical protein